MNATTVTVLLYKPVAQTDQFFHEGEGPEIIIIVFGIQASLGTQSPAMPVAH